MPDDGLFRALNVRMVLTYSALAIMVVPTLVTQSKANIGNGTTPIIKAILDPKRRNELIDEAFLEQKDILLDMLEAKLKEVRDKKKVDRSDNVNEAEPKCESMPKNVDIVLKAQGISAIGDTDVRLKYGEDGNGTLSLDATGISNVGKTHVELGVVDGNVHIPGIDNVFTGESLIKKGCKRTKGSEIDYNLTGSTPKFYGPEVNDRLTRRMDRGEEKLDTVLTLNETTNYVGKSENNNNINDNNNNSSPRIDYSVSEAPEEISNTVRVINETNTLMSSV